MNRAGLAAPCVAYNQHRVAPAVSPRARTNDAADSYRKNRNAAKAARKAQAARKGPRQPAAAPPRVRGQFRALLRQGKAAAKRGDTTTVKRVSAALNALLALRFAAGQTVRP